MIRFILIVSISFLVSSKSFADLNEISQLNKILKKGYEDHYVPYIDRKSSSNIFNCVVHKFQTKEEIKTKIQTYNVPIKNSDTIIFQASDNFHFTYMLMGGEKTALYYKSSKLNQKILIGPDDFDKINFNFKLPQKSNNYKYNAKLTGLKNNKIKLDVEINFNTQNNNFEVTAFGSEVKKEIGSYYIKMFSNCDGKLMALDKKQENIKLANNSNTNVSRGVYCLGGSGLIYGPYLKGKDCGYGLTKVEAKYYQNNKILKDSGIRFYANNPSQISICGNQKSNCGKDIEFTCNMLKNKKKNNSLSNVSDQRIEKLFCSHNEYLDNNLIAKKETKEDTFDKKIEIVDLFEETNETQKELDYLLSTFQLDKVCEKKENIKTDIKIDDYYLEKIDIFCLILDDKKSEANLLNSILNESSYKKDELFNSLSNYFIREDDLNKSILIKKLQNIVSEEKYIKNQIPLYVAMYRIGALPFQESFIDFNNKDLLIATILSQDTDISLRIKAANAAIYLDKNLISGESLSAIYSSVDFNHNQLNSPKKTLRSLKTDELKMAFYHQLVNIQIFPRDRMEMMIEYFKFASSINLELPAYVSLEKMLNIIEPTTVSGIYNVEEIVLALKTLGKDELAKLWSKANKLNVETVEVIKPKKKEKPKVISEDDQNLVVENDNEGPRITIANTFEGDEDYTASIKGKITDQSEIVSVTVDGDEVALKQGSFNKDLFVRPNGQSVQIIARDKHGNKSETTVQLVRSTIIVSKDTFDFLDPRKIKVETNQNAVALIIGVEEYETISPALFAKNDALAFNDFAKMSLGVPQNNIKLLTNDDAGRNDTIKVLKTWLPKKIVENKTDLFIFYSGHGLATDDGSDLYLLPSDGDPDILEDTSILRNSIFDIITNLNPKTVTMFLDTCYSGTTRSEEFLIAAKPILVEPEEQEIPINFNIFSAASGKQTAKILEEAEHGLFSYFMMKGLEGEADSNNDRTITNGELHAFINKNVSRQANQTPQLNGDPEQVLVQW